MAAVRNSPKGFNANGPPMCSNTPWRPVKAASGAVMPSPARSAANIAFLQAYAVAAPFHIESSPARVTRGGTFPTAVMATACAICAAARRRTWPAPAAAAMPMAKPWSQPRSRSLAAAMSRAAVS